MPRTKRLVVAISMVHVTGTHCTVPPFRLPMEQVRDRWGGGTRGVERRSVKAIDDDSVTLGIEAARGVLPRGASVDVLVVATTSPVYGYGSTAPLVCDALGLGSTTHTLSLSESARAGTAALRTARDALRGSPNRALVIASEAPTPAPGSERERTVGAGACATMLEADAGDAAEFAIEATTTRSRPVLDEWQAPDSTERTLADDRFRRDVGYVETAGQAVRDVVEMAGWEAEDVDALAANLPASGFGAKLADSAGLPSDRVAGTRILAQVGDLGAAGSAAALSGLSAGAGDRIVLAGYGSGVADAIALTATEDVAGNPTESVQAPVDLDYVTYLEHTQNLRRD